jgi:hypothetical protein
MTTLSLFRPHLLWILVIFMSIHSQAQNALDFDGSNDQVTVPAASGLIANSMGMSMGFWVYPTNNNNGWPDFDGYAGFRNDANADFYILQLSGSNIEARFRNSSGAVFTITYNGSLNLNTWNHFVLTYNGSTLTLYHDGTSASSIPANGTISSTSEAFNIGLTPFSGNNFYFQGRMDDLGLWSRALSSSEVSTLYNACGPDLSDSTLQLSYDFNQGIAAGNNSSITTLTDGTGNINGNLSGFSLSGNASNFVSSPLQGIYNLNLNVNSCGPYLAPNGVLYSQSGQYTDTISPLQGCDTIMNLNLTVTLLDSSASRIANNRLEANESDTAASFQWLNCNTNYSPIFGAKGKQFTFVQNGSYAVEVTLGNCVDTSACIVINNVGLKEHGPSFSVFPNPSQGVFELEYPVGVYNQYEVLNINGQCLAKGSLEEQGKSKLELKYLATGIYLLKLSGQSAEQIQRIQIEP